MQFDEERYSKQNKFPYVQAVIGSSILILLIVLIVFLTNSDGSRKRPSESYAKVNKQDASVEENVEEDEVISAAPKKRAQDLNFWNMYPEDEKNTGKGLKEEPVVSKPSKKEVKVEEEEDSPAKDGKHVEVVLDDGSKEWLAINKSLPANPYEDTGFQKEDGIMKFYRNNRNISYTGLTLDSYCGAVDFEAAKKAGVHFTMLRLGTRGYDTGVITEDSSFEKYYNDAKNAGLQIGVYFSTQALTAQEAAEEADFVIQKLAEHNITYPVGVNMDVLSGNAARTVDLSKNDRTTNLRIFMETIAAAGYEPILMGDKNSLILKTDQAALSGFSVWLDHNGELPEYPYKFSMWQYTENGQIKGVDAGAKLNISLVDFSAR